jgi:sulfur transfer complex TusBCD TusB component (DsrH family)
VTWTTSPYNFTYNATNFGLGRYTMRLVVKDKNSNQAENTITLRIYENVTPVVQGPENLEYYFTQTGHSLRWNVTDEHMHKYVIRRNDTMVANGSLSSDSPFVVISVDGLGIGTYVYSFTANDTSGNQATDNVTVTVKGDDVSPVISYAPATVYYMRGDVGIVRNWTATDDFKASYNITVDGFVILTAPWDSEQISFDFSSLSEGEHWVILTVVDLGNNTASSAVMVVVSPPVISLVSLAVGSAVGALVIIGVVVWFVKYR